MDFYFSVVLRKWVLFTGKHRHFFKIFILLWKNKSEIPQQKIGIGKAPVNLLPKLKERLYFL